ncbi:MAG TPA: DUF3987 domain-containing protein [Acidimicrobiales bacterium]|nr:DUF3987 domain-containing protein [Acidimicrobiales bacterium]
MSPVNSAELAPAPGWPAPPAGAAYQGMAGALVSAIAPHTEADPVAILAQLLVAAGVTVGRGAWAAVEATRHHPNEFVVVVGDSAKARKGSSWDHVARLMGRAVPGFGARTSTGLSSGEGLVWALRDPEGADPGAADPRLLVVEPEFASVLKATTRDVNTLSPVLRSAWDGRPLALLTRTAPARASGPHLSVIGHITAAELTHYTSSLEVANGLLNRFFFVAARRVRLLPEGGDPDPLAGTGMEGRLGTHLTEAKRRGRMRFSTGARAAWWDAYARMAGAGHGPDGIVAGLLARAEAHVLRLSLLYALVDGAASIGLAHLEAALALWEYSTDSVAKVFAPVVGDPLAEAIHDALVARPDGMTRTEIRDFLVLLGILWPDLPDSASRSRATPLQRRQGRSASLRVPSGLPR